MKNGSGIECNGRNSARPSNSHRKQIRKGVKKDEDELMIKFAVLYCI